MNKPLFREGKMCGWVLASLFSCFVFTAVHCVQSHSAQAATPNIQIKVLGARTDSRLGKYTGVVDPKVRARVVLVHIQVPAGLEFSVSNPHRDQNGETVDETHYTLQDSKGTNYMNGDPQGLGISNLDKNNVQSISWIAPNTLIPLQVRKSLRFKARLYFFRRSSKGMERETVGSRWVDVPLKYHS